LVIGEVFRTSGGALVAQEGLAPEKVNGAAAKRSFDAIGPRLIPLPTAEGTHHMDLDRGYSHLQHPTTVCDHFRSQFYNGKAARLERAQQSGGVVRGGANEDVEITCEARRAVEREGLCADDDELNAMGSQGSDKLVEVWRQIHRPASADTQPPRCVPPPAAIASSAAPVGSAPLRQTM
jgi:hypothetical protein